MTDSPDPTSIPMLTDVIVPGRPPVGRPVQAPSEEPSETKPESPVQAQAPLAHSTASPQPDAISQPAFQTTPTPPAPASAGTWDMPAAAFGARDVEFIAERLRGRFSSYLREDARLVIEARCRDAIEEHTNWLVRQVTREVVSALEAEVAGWVRDAVREELARHTSGR